MKILEARAEVAPQGRYRHWDTLRHLTPPEGLTNEQWWLGIKAARRPQQRSLPLVDAAGQHFTYSMPDEAQELLHYITQHASGEIAMPEVVTASESARRQFLVNSLIEEAIRSSQLEGATTSRVVAKEMIRSGRPPVNRSERMIFNNYRALEYLRGETGDPLTPELVFRLQRILTEGTLEHPDAAGRLQTIGEPRVAVYERNTGEIVHQPPPANQLEERLQRMLRFANGEEGTSGFLHPVIRAILLHFWLAYDHPFEDGNGRTARGLFYWSMRVQGYWLTEYLSISRILRQAPSKYGAAFLYAETDDGDTTYFILYHLGVIRRAIEEMRAHLGKKAREIRDFKSLVQRSSEFNYRQIALLVNAVSHPEATYTFKGHALTHNVTRQSARTDLLDLLQRGLFDMHREGKEYVFTPVRGLQQKLRGPVRAAH